MFVGLQKKLNEGVYLQANHVLWKHNVEKKQTMWADQSVKFLSKCLIFCQICSLKKKLWFFLFMFVASFLVVHSQTQQTLRSPSSFQKCQKCFERRKKRSIFFAFYENDGRFRSSRGMLVGAHTSRTFCFSSMKPYFGLRCDVNFNRYDITRGVLKKRTTEIYFFAINAIEDK